MTAKLIVRRISSQNQAAWTNELRKAAAFPALDAWPRFIEKVYSYPSYCLEAYQSGQLLGVLILTFIRHPIFGHFLTTAPFASYGGFAYASILARNALLEEAKQLRKELHAKYVVVRLQENSVPSPNDWLPQSIYATYLLDLSQPLELLMKEFGSNHRNHIRKSLKRGFTILFGHLELLDDVYQALTQCMHELGSPYHSKRYLREMAQSMGTMLEFAVLYDSHHRLAGAGVFILYEDTATNLHANIMRSARSDYAGEFLYWSAISRYAQMGFQYFDMGRSLLGSGNDAFKSKWMPHKRMLSYWYQMDESKKLPDFNQKNPKFRLAIWIWKRLPLWVVKTLGPSLIRGLA